MRRIWKNQKGKSLTRRYQISKRGTKGMLMGHMFVGVPSDSDIRWTFDLDTGETSNWTLHLHFPGNLDVRKLPNSKASLSLVQTLNRHESDICTNFVRRVRVIA